MDNKQEISKIKVNDITYDIKDTELRRMLDILLGNVSAGPEESDRDDENAAIQ